NTGSGIYNRCAPGAGGQRPDESRTYAVTITRLSGPRGSVPHALRWVGNDGTFSSAGTVSLPLGQPRTVQVKATPAAGVHAALLQVDDPSTPGADAMSMQTVVAAEPLPG